MSFAHICPPTEGSAEAVRSAGLVLVMPTADITCLSLGLRLHLFLVYLPSVLVNPLERDRYVALDRCGALIELFVKIEKKCLNMNLEFLVVGLDIF